MVAFHRFANAYIPIERVNAMLVLVIEALFDSIAARLPSTAVVKVGYFALNKRSIPLEARDKFRLQNLHRCSLCITRKAGSLAHRPAAWGHRRRCSPNKWPSDRATATTLAHRTLELGSLRLLPGLQLARYCLVRVATTCQYKSH